MAPGVRLFPRHRLRGRERPRDHDPGRHRRACAPGGPGSGPARWSCRSRPRPARSRRPLPAARPRAAAYDSRTARLAVAGLDEILPAVRRAVARHGADRVGLVARHHHRRPRAHRGGVPRAAAAPARCPADYDLHRQHSFGGLIEAVRRAAGDRRALLRRCRPPARPAPRRSAARSGCSAPASSTPSLVGGVDGALPDHAARVPQPARS